MRPSFRKQMIAGAIATLLSAPAWTASVTETQTGSEAGASTGSSSSTGTSQTGTAYGSDSGTTSGSAGAGTNATSGTSVTNAGSTSRSMGTGSARSDNPLYSRTGDDLVGSEIVGASGDDIGEINRIVLSQDRRGAHAVVAIGGFLGLGEHDIAVSLDELQPVGDDKWQLNATKEQLESRPEYRSEQYVELEGHQPISGSITDFAAFGTDQSSRPVTSQSDTAYGSASGNTSGLAGTATTAADSGSTSGSMGAGTGVDSPLYSRSGHDGLIGAGIVNASGDDIGEIEKIVLTQDRRGAHAVVSVGGFLGLGEHDIVVSLDELRQAGDGKWQLNATKEQLEARPEYRSAEYVELEGDQPNSGSTTDFAVFETDGNNSTGTSPDSNSGTTMEKMLDKDENGLPLTESGATGGSSNTNGSGTTGTGATQ